MFIHLLKCATFPTMYYDYIAFVGLLYFVINIQSSKFDSKDLVNLIFAKVSTKLTKFKFFK